ncbi:hypothetical protein DLM78_05465 [Leptospira stimsonii]|uniref:Uncharacterized protein n=1 Tax=Leptospira stimsonii TaxID=2202203 RepID=A0A8B3CWU7_9LEPT|nr:hypothetical protein DLM78_05465 [Leptospira stimsonii]
MDAFPNFFSKRKVIVTCEVTNRSPPHEPIESRLTFVNGVGLCKWKSERNHWSATEFTVRIGEPSEFLKRKTNI